MQVSEQLWLAEDKTILHWQLGYNLGWTEMGDEGGLYMIKSNLIISQLSICKFIIIQVPAVSLILSTFDNYSINCSPLLHKSIYDAQ